MKKRISKIFSSGWGQRLLIIALIMLVMLFLQRRFFRLSNVTSILLDISVYGIMAGGMMFTVLTGGMDLSVGAMAAMTATTLTAIVIDNGYTATSFFAGIVICLAACVVVGLIHGVLVAVFRIPAFVVTLATLYGITGIVQMLTGGYFNQPMTNGIFYQFGNAKILQIPMPVIFLIIFTAIYAVILGKTTFGKKLYAVGGNETASKLVGINSTRTIIIGYVISSASAGIGGMILSSMNMQGGTTTAQGYEGNVLMAIVVGGINLAGGEGDVWGAIFGALLVGIIVNIQVLVGIPADYQKFVQGLIILAAIIINTYTTRRGLGLTRRRFQRKAV
ncbi:MAG: ABC transporter permease [Oscillospiraceae bacterium]|nr:ABC transporter permease [Oscillospiraceae bacterium]